MVTMSSRNRNVITGNFRRIIALDASRGKVASHEEKAARQEDTSKDKGSAATDLVDDKQAKEDSKDEADAAVDPVGEESVSGADEAKLTENGRPVAVG